MAAYPYDHDSDHSFVDDDEEGRWIVLLVGHSRVFGDTIFDDVLSAAGPFSTLREAKAWCHGHSSTRIVSCLDPTWIKLGDTTNKTENHDDGFTRYHLPYGISEEELKEAGENQKTQEWYDEVQEIVGDLDGYEDGLGEFLLDYCNWDDLFFEGRTPEQALNVFMDYLSANPDVLKAFQQQRGYEK